MTIVRARLHRVWDVDGYDHTLSCGCHYFDRGALDEYGKTVGPLANGTYVFCSTHESTRSADRTYAA